MSFEPEKLPFWLSECALFKNKTGSSDNRVLDSIVSVQHDKTVVDGAGGVNRRDLTRQTDTFGKVYKCVSFQIWHQILLFSAIDVLSVQRRPRGYFGVKRISEKLGRGSRDRSDHKFEFLQF